MRVFLYVEGDTEFLCLPPFFQKWLRSRIDTQVDIKPINLQGVGNYKRNLVKLARRDLQSPYAAGAIGLIDYYGSGFGGGEGSLDEKCARAKQQIEQEVGLANFYQHFAVHETEAWLFSDPTIHDPAIQPRLPTTQLPETINTNNPPGQVLDTLFKQRLNGRIYKKTSDGAYLFGRLDPQSAYNRCSYLRMLLDDLLILAIR